MVSSVIVSVILSPQRMFKRAAPARPRGEGKRQAYPFGYLDDCFEPRTKPNASFNILPLHVTIFAEQFHSTPFILRPARSLCHRGVPQLVNNVVHGFRC